MVNVPKSYLPEESFFTPNYSVKWISPVPWLQSFGGRDIFLKTNTESSRLECGRCSSIFPWTLAIFSAWQVGQYAYYAKVTESAEKSMKGCAAAVLQAFQKMMDFFQTANSSRIVANWGFH